MQYAFFRIDASHPQADTDTLNEFLGSNAVTSIERQFVADGANSFWSVCVVVADSSSTERKPGKRSGIDYRELLSPEDFAVFAKLRSHRNELAREQGIPSYTIFTNEQLAQMVQLQPATRQTLAEIDGIGEKRLEQYADVFLALLAHRDG